MKILVTGVAGYIGSITAELLIKNGHKVVGIDNLSTGHEDNINGLIEFHNIDIRDSEKLGSVLGDSEAVIHFAAKTSVGESVSFPELYHSNNIEGSKSLLSTIEKAGIKILIFSSSAAVYGNPISLLINEAEQNRPINPYGVSKLETEKNISILCSQGQLGAISLRYFNVAGALNTGKKWLSERHDPETHLVPNVISSTVDKPLKIFGTNFNTSDGTCIRDYVHVVDIARAHILAIDKVITGENRIINIGSGSGNSVLEVLETAEEVVKRKIPKVFVDRRDGDPERLVADIRKALEILDWKPMYSLRDMINDAFQAKFED